MLNALNRIMHKVSIAPTLQDALQIMVDGVQGVIAAHITSIYLIDSRYNHFVLAATTEGTTPLTNKTTFAFDQGLVGLVALRGQTVKLDDLRLLDDIKLENPNRSLAFLGVPIIHQRKILGVILVEEQKVRVFNRKEETFLATLATQLAAIIAHAVATGEVTRFFDALEHAKNKKELVLQGIPVAAGIGIGTAVFVYPLADLDAVPDRSISEQEQLVEILQFEAALKQTQGEIKTLRARLQSVLPPEELELFDVYLKILEAKQFSEEVVSSIREGNWAQGALKKVVKKHILQFEKLDNPYLSERGVDIRDLGTRILFNLQMGGLCNKEFPHKTILIGEEITASILLDIPAEYLAGIVSIQGSANSHVAILARALNIPTVTAVKDLDFDQMNGKEIIVDGSSGTVYVAPNKNLLKQFKELKKQAHQVEVELEHLRDLPAVTACGERVILSLNAGLMFDSQVLTKTGADGIGLFRSEISFMSHEYFLSEEEQFYIYRDLLEAFAPRPVVIRTLDIGADKTLPYFSFSEPNPFLGWRGIRISLDHPDLFLVQIRALLRANFGLNNLQILFPMITTLEEVEQAISFCKQAYDELTIELPSLKMPEIGAMIEVPSAVRISKSIAERVHFLSVGSNDLTQYILAVDRNNARVANLFQELHPAVLSALKQSVDGAHAASTRVTICGEMASHPAIALLLLGLGFDELSVHANQLLRIKAVIRSFTKEEARKIAMQALEMERAEDIRLLLEQALIDHDLEYLLQVRRKTKKNN